MLDRTAMHVSMVFGRFARVMGRMQPVSVSDMRVVGGLFMIAVLVVTGGFAVVGRGMLVMFSRFSMMFRSFVVFHSLILSPGEMFGRRRQCRIQSNSRPRSVTA